MNPLSKKPETWADIKHFRPEEFACSHCGTNGIDFEWVKVLDTIRGALGEPIIINSGYRCKEFDDSIGGKGNHPLGIASDIRITEGAYLSDLLHMAMWQGVRRMIVYPKRGFMHMDNNLERPRGLWFSV